MAKDGNTLGDIGFAIEIALKLIIFLLLKS